MRKSFQSLVANVLPYLETHQDDILVLDKNMLKGYEGSILIGYRKSGSNTYRLDARYMCDWSSSNLRKSSSKVIESHSTFLLNNEYFAHIDKDGEFTQLTSTLAHEAILAAYDEAMEIISFFETIKLEQMAFDLYHFIQSNGRMWKHRMVQDWDSGTSIQTLTLLRNRWGSDTFTLLC